ncbi:threonine transporter RhtB [Rhodospirillum rubrum]|uniref:LysE family translocator n=1 Tax=Rhodospirillum rubrum TaxID=1085 RepID=UPI001908EA81|nr:LysE family translocator [Rhodospirillum rubrum]MBK1663448.1 threonine transporter RhtB [Rhodospirillum rubrum]MBK1675369.1 threonine transporter RhtB [Rhodospirillum rubrum]
MIVSPDTLWLFVPAALALNLTPGNDMLFCLGQGMRGGPAAGMAASLGVATGGVVHTLLAAFGLAALVAAHPGLFAVIRWVGVGYLLWLGLQTLRRPMAPPAFGQAPGGSAGVLRAWREGIVVNLLNPKVVVFVLAFLPQFVKPEAGPAVPQMLVLGGILSLGGTVVNGVVGALAGGIGRTLATSRRAREIFRWVSGLVFVGLAARLAFERR